MGKRDDILNAVSVVFKKYGFAKTTLDDIAQECGMKNTALYYYFESKEDIINGMFNSDMKKIQDNIRNAVAKQDTAKNKIHAFVLEKLISFKNQKRYFDLVLREDLSIKHRQLAFEQKNKFDKFERDLLTEIIAEGVKNDLFENHPIESLIYMITGTTWGISYFVLCNDTEIDLESVVDDVIEIMFSGLKKTPNSQNKGE